MTISNLESVFYTLSFVVPGFICDSVIASIIPRKNDLKETLFLRYFTLSCLNYALWVWLIYLLIKVDFFRSHHIHSAIAWFLIIFVSPIFIGLILGKQSSKGWIRKFLIRVGINPIHPIPTAWDFFFSTTPPVWVLVTLKDGSQVGGLFGSKSFVSSDRNERDMYIQEIYRIVEDGPWKKIDNSRGIFVNGSEIKHIEFLE